MSICPFTAPPPFNDGPVPIGWMWLHWKSGTHWASQEVAFNECLDRARPFMTYCDAVWLELPGPRGYRLEGIVWTWTRGASPVWSWERKARDAAR